MIGRLVSLSTLVVIASCAEVSSARTGSTTTTPTTTRRMEAPVVHGPCRAEYLADVGMSGVAFRVEGVGDFAAAVVGDTWTFECRDSGRTLVLGQTRDTQRSLGVEIDATPADGLSMTDYLSRFIEAANARLVEAGFTIVRQVGPRALSEDTVVMAVELQKDGSTGTQFVIMRGLRSSVGVLRYTAIEFGQDPSRIEPAIEALFRASRAFMPIE